MEVDISFIRIIYQENSNACKIDSPTKNCFKNVEP